MIKISSAIFKTFFLSLCIVANTHFAFGQTASVLPPGYTQYLDNNGKPLSAGKVYNYIPSTTTPKTTWQDAGETIANTNPVTLDAGGRAKILGDGSYRQIVKDRNGNTIWDAVTSSTGSGSSSSTATGDGDLVGTIKPWAGMTAPNQYAFTYGQEVSRTTYSALYTAITSSQSVFCNSGSPTLNGLSDTTNFWIGMSVEVSCVAVGFSTIISKTSSSVTLAVNANVTANTTAVFFPWGRGNGTTTFNLPDLRGFVIAGNDIMGGVSAGRLPQTYFNSSNSIGSSGGAASQTIFNTNLPPYTPAGTISNGAITSTFTGSNSAINFGVGGTGNFASGSFAGQTVAGTVSSTQATSTFSGTPSGGNSTPFSIIQPTKTANYIIKITPDTNSATASGVTSIQSMTGDIACGTGLTCTGNIISSAAATYLPPYTGGVPELQSAYNAQRLSVLDFGAKGDTVTLYDGAISNGTNTFTSATAAFTVSDVGKVIRILGAGAAGAILETTIASYISTTSVGTTTSATTTVTGAKTYYGSDDTVAIQAAINTMAVGASVRASSCILLPNRIFITTVVLTVPAFTNICIEGAGSSLVSPTLGSIIQPATNSIGLTIASSDQSYLRGFGIFYPAEAAVGSSAINFAPPAGAFNYFTKVVNVSIANAYNGIVADRMTYAVFDGVEIIDFKNAAISQSNALSSSGLVGDTGDLKIINSGFIGIAGAITCLYWQAGGGLTFQNNKCSSANIGVQINPAANVNTSQLSIQTNSFDGMATAGLFFSRQDATSQINALIFSGNTCNLFNALATECVSIPTDAGGVGLKTVVITNNTVYGPGVANNMFGVDSVDNLIIGDNALRSNHAATVGVNIGSAATNITVGPQTFTGTFLSKITNASVSLSVANAVPPSNGGIVYTTSDQLAVLAGTATAGQMLRSGSSTAPTWSTATWPATTTGNQLLYSSSANVVAGLATANDGVLITSGAGVPSISSTLPAAVQGNITAVGTIASGVWSGTNIALNKGGTNASLTASDGGIFYSTATAGAILAGTATANLPLLSGSTTAPSWASISYPTSANSGGIPYFSSATAISSSAALTANSIVVGGGAGVAPFSSGCTINSNNSMVCSSATAFTPQLSVTNTTSDANAAQIQVSKSRSAGDTQNGDALGYFVFQGFANSGYRSTAVLQVSQVGAVSGSVVPSKMQMTTSNATATQNQQMTFDNNAHLGVTLQSVAPTLTAGCNGAGSSITGGGGVANDTHGTVTGQTAAATTCTLTFGVAYTNTPDCVFSGFQSPITVVNNVSTSSFQITFASTANYKFSYHCRGV